MCTTAIWLVAAVVINALGIALAVERKRDDLLLFHGTLFVAAVVLAVLP
jgi:predicted cobalt transporter CbtA